MTNQHPSRIGVNDLIGDKRDAILKLAEQYGAYNVRIFGSAARGEARPDSDVDFLVEFREGASIFDAVGLWQDLTTLMGCEVDLVTVGADEEFEAWVEKDAILL